MQIEVDINSRGGSTRLHSGTAEIGGLIHNQPAVQSPAVSLVPNVFELLLSITLCNVINPTQLSETHCFPIGSHVITWEAEGKTYCNVCGRILLGTNLAPRGLESTSPRQYVLKVQCSLESLRSDGIPNLSPVCSQDRHRIGTRSNIILE